MSVIAGEIAALGGQLTRGRRMSFCGRKFHRSLTEEVLANDRGFGKAQGFSLDF